jgi:spermidine/putrescine transport system substrate-binding protein
MTAIGYDAKQTGGDVTSLEQFFDPKYKGKVTMLSDAREATSMVLLMQGKRPEDASIDEVLAAVDYVDEQNRKGHIRKFTGNDYTGDLQRGNIAMAQAYSGDVIQLQADNKNLRFSIPEQGAVLWSDNMMIPQKPRTAYGAEVFMNYVYDPEVAAKIAAYVNYVTPVKGAQEVLAESDRRRRRAAERLPEPLGGGGAADERGVREGRRGVAGWGCAPGARSPPTSCSRRGSPGSSSSSSSRR